LLVSAGRDVASSVTNVVLPTKIDEFMSSRSQPVVALHFSADGTSLAVIQRDGYVVKTFKIRPIASVVSSGIFSGSKMDNSEVEMRKQWSDHLHQQTSNSVKMYTLRRGRTSAVVEGADWSKDGRWLAIGTRKRTVHVFPVNPYGGKADIASHLEGRVRNVDVIVCFVSFI
jgi:WD40 repeat protein